MLFVVGVVMSGCVCVSVVDVMLYGFCLFVFVDCVGDCVIVLYDVNLFDMQQKYVVVMLFDDVIVVIDVVQVCVC